MNLDIEFLKVLADYNRMEILNFLKMGEKSFKQIMTHLNKTQSIVSANLKILSQESIIESRIEHGNKFFRIKSPKIYNLLQQITTFVLEKEQEKILAHSSNNTQDIL